MHRIGIVLLSIVLLSGCAGTTTIDSEVPPTPTRAAQTTAHPSEAPAMEPPAVRLDEPVISVGDDERRIRVYVPDPMPAGEVPLLLFLHQFGGSASEAVRDTGFDRLAGEEGFIAAFPPAGGRGWAATVTEGLSDTDVDEVYLDGLLDELLASYSIDIDRVYVAGFSVGAVMAGRVACRLADRIAGAAIVSGNVWAGPCEPSRPVPILIIHGTGDGTYSYDAAVRLADTWRELDGCTGTPAEEPVGTTAAAATSTDCAGGATVRFVTVDNGWHTWFRDPDATRLSWEFFEGTARP
jgi:polyhydroxybutyrate depolymerase